MKLRTIVLLAAVVLTVAAGAFWLARHTMRQLQRVEPAPPPALTEVDTLAAQREELQTLVHRLAGPHGQKTSVVVLDPNRNLQADYNPQTRLVSASLYKLFVAAEIYHEVDKGTLVLTDSMPNAGNTVQECLRQAITVSDNPCAEELGKLIGWAELDSRLAADGYANTTLNNYFADGRFNGHKHTTAQDVGKLLLRLYRGELLSETSTQSFIDLLKQQTINDRLPTGLAASAQIAHKTGELEGYSHDAGIVYGGKHDYIVVVMSGSWHNPAAEAAPFFRDLSRELWTFFQK